VPVFGVVSAALAFGEHFSPLRLSGMALIFVGVTIVAVPAQWFARRRRTA
jgi:drug/metabolite transporter (DMT)-like permease